MHTELAVPLVYDELVMQIDRSARTLGVNSGLSWFFFSFFLLFFFPPSNCLCMSTRYLAGKNQVD